MNQTVNNMSLSIIRKFGPVALIVVASVVLLHNELALAMQSGPYQLTRSTIDSGGTTSTGGPYVISGTIGQHDSGWLAGGNYEILGGFWPEIPACIVNFEHFARFARYWLDTGTGLPADLHEDSLVNSLDLGVFVDKWLDCCPRGWPLAYDYLPEVSDAMVWISIDDPGVSGHEPFNREMSKYETTNAQYCQFLNEALTSGDLIVDVDIIRGAIGSNSGIDFDGEVYYNLAGSGYTLDGATDGGAERINYTGGSFTVDNGFENHPVTYVSWYGATAFCNYYDYRLPTKWEWQAVADYDGSYIYGCGTSINNSIANYLGSTHPDGTIPVGSLGDPSGYGYEMCDMAGNVWEWTSDRFALGGCWSVNDTDCEVSSTHSHAPDYTDDPTGFRVCQGSPLNGVVSRWSFNEGSGSVAVDNSGNGHDGTINGATVVDGISGKALSFDGVDDYVSLPSSSNLSFYSLTEEFSTSFWIKPDSVAPSDQAILEHDDDYLVCLNGGVLSYRKTDLHNLYHNSWQSTNPEITAGTWTHVAITYDGSGAGGTKMYVDGTEVLVTNTAHHGGGGSGTGDNFAIGIRAFDLTTTPFGGQIDEVRIYNRVLSPAEISIVARWSFNEGSGSVAVDNSGNGHDGTINGATVVDGISGKALSFDGVDDYVRIPYDNALQFSGVTSTQSISFWMYVDDYDYYAVLENKDNYLVYIQPDGKLRYAQSDSGNLYHRTFTVNNPMPLSQWNHVVITYDGTDQASSTVFHVNGTINSNVYTGQHSGWSAGSGDFAIGAELAGGIQAFFKGKIDGVKIYNKVLTPTEIQNLYQYP